ncbi:MAG TPA: L,D-transpeptidase [Prosthecobacter sp.]
MPSLRHRFIVIVCCLLAGQGALRAKAPIEAITFADRQDVFYLPLMEAARELHWEVEVDETGRCLQFGPLPVSPGALRALVDGTELVQQHDLELAGATISAGENPATLVVRRGFYRFTLVNRPKHVEVSLSQQQLRGWQGGRLILQTHISSGRNGRTPAGTFSAGPFRARMHRSSLYHNAPMPWSVQINGNVFIHGFDEVPDYPASHGCIRMPLDGGNPARFFYEWVDTGTPVVVR